MGAQHLRGIRNFPQAHLQWTVLLLEDLGYDDIALGLLGLHTPPSVVLVRYRRLQDLLVLQGIIPRRQQERGLKTTMPFFLIRKLNFFGIRQH